jgi:hypothetical protein
VCTWKEKREIEEKNRKLHEEKEGKSRRHTVVQTDNGINGSAVFP